MSGGCDPCVDACNKQSSTSCQRNWLHGLHAARGCWEPEQDTPVAKKGAKVVCVARTMSDGEHPLEGSLTNTVESIRAKEGEATALSANISDFDQCDVLYGWMYFGTYHFTTINEAGR